MFKLIIIVPVCLLVLSVSSSPPIESRRNSTPNIQTTHEVIQTTKESMKETILNSTVSMKSTNSTNAKEPITVKGTTVKATIVTESGDVKSTPSTIRQPPKKLPSNSTLSPTPTTTKRTELPAVDSANKSESLKPSLTAPRLSTKSTPTTESENSTSENVQTRSSIPSNKQNFTTPLPEVKVNNGTLASTIPTTLTASSASSTSTASTTSIDSTASTASATKNDLQDDHYKKVTPLQEVPLANQSDIAVKASEASDKLTKGTLIALVSSLTFGLIFIIIVVIVVGKRVYEGYKRRHYTQIDYLVDGNYKQK
ncbi:DgyrCDS9980 [Dimorphilus gyrociliatus]|uniref:DgyrCDS9980 n=1 Tax=Dimorphilus gyrociliatus TaxID=2664684 RepID=A0A7I8W000_9ANNE|nr:DgyrCDS9980 [Dimorphilus gyrociliatus]